MSLCLTPDEIAELTGLTLPRCQVRRLQEQGFDRARLVRGRAVLERVHYDAVCRGEFAAGPETRDTPRPKLRPVPKAA
jgi:hypothetical protein